MNELINTMRNKTPEERRAIALKAHATRKANKEAEQRARQDALAYAGGLREEIALLEAKLASLKRMETMNAVSAALTGKTLLTAKEIVDKSLLWESSTGVYFLIDDDEVVYVGQSVSIHSRIPQHRDKRFDRYAFVPCESRDLDRLESLYIHCLRPRLNGNQVDGVKCAPMALDVLLKISRCAA